MDAVESSTMNSETESSEEKGLISDLPNVICGEEMHVTLDSNGRLSWEPSMHRRFYDAVMHLGGLDYATPQRTLSLMNATGLTRQHLKSHFQKIRGFIRRWEAGACDKNSSIPFYVQGFIPTCTEGDTSSIKKPILRKRPKRTPVKITPELHARFCEAVIKLGGVNAGWNTLAAKPNKIRELMDVEGLSRHVVKTHLTKIKRWFEQQEAPMRASMSRYRTKVPYRNDAGRNNPPEQAKSVFRKAATG
ncbi:hypothetical protein ACP70R_034439 [Stipagrostis hirtigluma subsp. patula]